MQKRLIRRELHQIVRELNETVLSKVPENARVARAALDRLGFSD